MTDAALGPVPPQERIQLVDVLRGFALLGILQVNWESTSGWLNSQIEFFADGSFYTTYSFLFGLGFALQIIRAEEAGRSFLLRYIWRTAILFLIGASHFIFIWGGDILRIYGLAAVVLLIVRRVRPALVVTLAAALLVFAMAPRVPPPGQVFERVNPEQVETNRLVALLANTRNLSPADLSPWCRMIPGLTDAYCSAVSGNIVGVRNLVTQQVTTVRWWQGEADILCMFLLGLYAGRRRILRDTAQHTPFLLWVAGTALVFGLAGNALDVYTGFFEGKGIAVPDAVGRWVSPYNLGNIGLSLFYLSSVTLIFTHWRWAQRVLAPLANVGRMGLTNYLMQSLIFTSILGARGFGVMAHVKEGYSLLLINAFFVVQILYSSWWFRHFRFGPVEWVWRSLTWWRLQPMRKPVADASGGAN